MQLKSVNATSEMKLFTRVIARVLVCEAEIAVY
jgi:hypothetical protein